MGKGTKPSLVKFPDGDLQPVDEVVAALARLLVEARAGNIKGIAVAYVTAGRPFTGSTSGIAPDDLHTAVLLKGAIADLQHEWQHALRGK